MKTVNGYSAQQYRAMEPRKRKSKAAVDDGLCVDCNKLAEIGKFFADQCKQTIKCANGICKTIATCKDGKNG